MACILNDRTRLSHDNNRKTHLSSKLEMTNVHTQQGTSFHNVAQWQCPRKRETLAVTTNLSKAKKTLPIETTCKKFYFSDCTLHGEIDSGHLESDQIKICHYDIYMNLGNVFPHERKFTKLFSAFLVDVGMGRHAG